MGSNTNTAPGRERVTYVEEKNVVRQLEELAASTGLTVSALIRQATWDFVVKKALGGGPLIEADPGRGKTRQLPDRSKKPSQAKKS